MLSLSFATIFSFIGYPILHFHSIVSSLLLSVSCSVRSCCGCCRCTLCVCPGFLFVLVLPFLLARFTFNHFPALSSSDSLSHVFTLGSPALSLPAPLWPFALPAFRLHQPPVLLLLLFGLLHMHLAAPLLRASSYISINFHPRKQGELELQLVSE